MLVELDDLTPEGLVQAALSRIVVIQSGPLMSAEWARVPELLSLALWAIQAARAAPPAVDPNA